MKKLFGGILLAAGILIGGASGLCSLAFLVMGLAEPSGGYVLSTLPLVAIVGGIPLGIGVGLFFGGRAILRSAREDEARDAIEHHE